MMDGDNDVRRMQNAEVPFEPYGPWDDWEDLLFLLPRALNRCQIFVGSTESNMATSVFLRMLEVGGWDVGREGG